MSLPAVRRSLLAVPLAIACAYGATSCGGATGQVVASAGSDWLACAEGDVGGAIGEAISAVEALGARNTAALEADALALIGTLGFDAVDCAVKIVEEIIAAATSTGSGSAAVAKVDLAQRAVGIARIRAVVERERPKHAAAHR